MGSVVFITHPEVVQSATVPVPRWGLNPIGKARMQAIAELAVVSGVTSVWHSTEQKAIDGGAILARNHGLTPTALAELGENDRSSTGYLTEDAFWPVVDAFFANPTQSIRGWEPASDAQARIVAAVRRVCEQSPAGDIAIVAHGGVGNLLMCHIQGAPISRSYAAKGMGSWCRFSRTGWDLLDDWAQPPAPKEEQGDEA